MTVFATITGTSGNDNLIGSDASDDSFYPLGGQDAMVGGAGDDWFFLDSGTPELPGTVINGGVGLDRIYCTGPIDLTQLSISGVEYIFGDQYSPVRLNASQLAGVSLIRGPLLITGSGTATFSAGIDNSIITFENGIVGADFTGAYGNLGFLRLNDTGMTAAAGAFPFIITGGAGNDVVMGGVGDDALYGNGGNNIVHGGDGRDTIQGGAGVNQLYGDADDDGFIIDSGTRLGAGSVLDGGTGVDGLLINAPGVDLSSITVTNIEKLQAYYTVTLTSTIIQPFSTLIGAFALSGSNNISLVGKTLGNFSLAMDSQGGTLDASDATIMPGSSNGVTVIGGWNGSNHITGTVGNDSIDTAGISDVILCGDGDDAVGIGSLSSNLTGNSFNGGNGSDVLNFYGTSAIYDISHASVTNFETLIFSSTINLTIAQLASFTTSVRGGTISLSDGGNISLNGVLGTNPNYSPSTKFQLSDLDTIIDLSGFLEAATTVLGGAGNDTIHGVSGSVQSVYFLNTVNSLYGGGGNDTLFGGSRDDYLDGGTGDNVLDGGSGYDEGRLDYSDRTQSVHLVNSGGVNTASDATINGVFVGSISNIESTSIVGGMGNDYIGGLYTNPGNGLSYFAQLDGQNGTDTAVVDISGFSSSRVTGFSNTFRAENNVGGSIDITLSSIEALNFTGSSGVDNLNFTALKGNSILRGAAGDDNIISGSGSDVLVGGDGDDILFGGRGLDAGIFGGNRADYTIGANGDGTYRVTDNRGGSPDGMDTMSSIERLQFADGTVRLPTGLDFNSDEVGDVLFRNATTGLYASWQVSGVSVPGVSSISGGGNIGAPGSNWRLAGHGDFDGDGYTDMVFCGRDGTFASWHMSGTSIVGGGTIGNPGAAWTMVDSGDFNGDDKSDLLFINAITGAYASWDLSGRSIVGGGTIGTPGPSWTYKATADFNGDGKSDILFQNVNGSYSTWTLNDIAIVGGGTIGNPGASWFFKGTGDFNGDGKSDLLFQKNDGTYATWDLNGNAITGGGTLGNTGAAWTLASIGDYNVDGKSDLLFRNANGSLKTWNLNDTVVISSHTLGNPGSGFSIAEEHGANDFGILIFQNSSTSTVASWKIGGGSIVGGGTLGAPGSLWIAKTVADFFGTGEHDVLFQKNDGTLAIWQSDGVSLIGGHTLGNAGANWNYKGAGDFNGDGKSDILFQNASTGQYATWNIGGSAIVGGGAIGVAAGYSFVATGDLNGDNKSDILFKDASGKYAAWFMDDTHIVSGGTIGNPGSAWAFKALVDLNGDSKSDILFENSSGTYATWDMDGVNIGGGGTIGNPGGTWQLAKAVDLNSDGKADLVFQNATGGYATWFMDDTHITHGTNLGNTPADWHLL